MNPCAKRVVLRFVHACNASLGESHSESLWRDTFFCGLSYEFLRESHRSARVAANPFAADVVLRFVQTSKRNISLGEIVMNPLARCIVLRFVVSIPRRHPALGEQCYESLCKPHRSASFVMNPFAKHVVLRFVNSKMQRIARRESIEIAWRDTLFCGLTYESLRESHSWARVAANPLASLCDL